jgi:hypothetical protein
MVGEATAAAAAAAAPMVTPFMIWRREKEVSDGT